MVQEMMPILSTLGTLLLMIAVFVGAYFVSKAVGKRQQFISAGFETNLKILERVPLGKEESLVIAKVANQIFLLGVTAQHIEKIGELDSSLILERPGFGEAPGSFRSVFQDMVQKRFHGKQKESGDDGAN